MISRQEYRKTEYFRESIELVKEFADYRLGGKLNRLKTFCFDELKGDLKFSYPKGENIANWKVDCDKTGLAQAIFCIVWGHIFNVKNGEIGSCDSKIQKAPFRGDTINSFNSLLRNSDSEILAFRARFYDLDDDIECWKRIHISVGNIIR